jgi:hypothetical protein
MYAEFSVFVFYRDMLKAAMFLTKEFFGSRVLE